VRRRLRALARAAAALPWRRVPPAGWIVLGVLALGAVNACVQVARKPTELLGLALPTAPKPPARTWDAYGGLFREHATGLVPAELLAALAQAESAGDPLARTYWRWRWSWNPLEVYAPASSAVGLLQMTDGTFEEARRLCVHLGEPALAVLLGRVDRQPGLLDDALGQVVDGRDAPAERCRQARARLERSGLERLAGQRAGDDGGRAVGQRCASGDLGNGEGQPAREARDETGLGVEPARAGEGAGHPDDPAASEVVLDVGRIDLGVVAGAGRDGHRLEAPDGGAGERRQRERGSVSHGSHRTGWSVPVPSTHARRCGGPPADAGAPAGAPDRARESRLAVPSRAAAVRRVGPDASA